MKIKTNIIPTITIMSVIYLLPIFKSDYKKMYTTGETWRYKFIFLCFKFQLYINKDEVEENKNNEN